jgi:hypothetical protein
MMPFFTFFGGKYRAAPRYPAPAHKVVIEPFAGSAGYAMRYPDRDVILVERDPVLAATWRYLLTASPSEIRALPLYGEGWASIDDLDLPDGARYLIGLWLNKGMTGPCKTPSAWMRNPLPGRLQTYWGAGARERIASQVDRIRHWQLIEGDYTAASDIEATWFIDPPYVDTGYRYRFGSRLIDYPALAAWCRGRGGQVMVCEHVGADWLPFHLFMSAKSTAGKRRDGVSKEALWTNAELQGELLAHLGATA